MEMSSQFMLFILALTSFRVITWYDTVSTCDPRVQNMSIHVHIATSPVHDHTHATTIPPCFYVPRPNSLGHTCASITLSDINVHVSTGPDRGQTYASAVTPSIQIHITPSPVHEQGKAEANIASEQREDHPSVAAVSEDDDYPPTFSCSAAQEPSTRDTNTGNNVDITRMSDDLNTDTAISALPISYSSSGGTGTIELDMCLPENATIKAVGETRVIADIKRALLDLGFCVLAGFVLCLPCFARQRFSFTRFLAEKTKPKVGDKDNEEDTDEDGEEDTDEDRYESVEDNRYKIIYEHREDSTDEDRDETIYELREDSTDEDRDETIYERREDSSD